MPRTPIHPGEHLADELRELGISAAELSRQIDVPVNRITGIIHGQRGITADTALRLGHWFGTSPQFWMNLQQLYELRLAESEIGEQIAALPRRGIDQRRENLEKRHEPAHQKTACKVPRGGRSPEGRASVSWIAGGAPAVTVKVASPRRQARAVCLVNAARAARAVCRGAGQGRRRAGAATHKSPDRGRDRG